MRNKHILVPLDLVHGPASALVAVREMAAETPISVTLLHVVELNIFPPQPNVTDQLCAESHAALRKLARLFFGAELAVKIAVRVGQPADQIIAEAKNERADLIVMSGPRKDRFPILRRDTAQNVVRSAACPTLVLPHPARTDKEKPACDLGRDASEEACFAGQSAAGAAIG